MAAQKPDEAFQTVIPRTRKGPVQASNRGMLMLDG
jgi:hypothetical protein